MGSKKCKWCEQGNVPKDGEHWIVKSIIPARIDIRECKKEPQHDPSK